MYLSPVALCEGGWLGDPFHDKESEQFVARYIERAPLSLEKLSIQDDIVTYTTKDGAAPLPLVHGTFHPITYICGDTDNATAEVPLNGELGTLDWERKVPGTNGGRCPLFQGHVAPTSCNNIFYEGTDSWVHARQLASSNYNFHGVSSYRCHLG